MPTRVKTLPRFDDRLEALEKKYRNAVDQAEKFTRRLENGERPGKVVPRVGAAVFKAWVRNPAVKGGARKGYRIIYYVIVRNEIYLLTMYSKSQQQDISVAELKQLVAAAEARQNL
ncbi:MAG: type II toxin-antitoxin system RelE/ParE family toxin [Chloroflexi bacterium]|nr:type II toxin-antitoxin system RelE/ParE family toxin [Chloroflexota bacterium]